MTHLLVLTSEAVYALMPTNLEARAQGMGGRVATATQVERPAVMGAGLTPAARWAQHLSGGSRGGAHTEAASACAAHTDSPPPHGGWELPQAAFYLHNHTLWVPRAAWYALRGRRGWHV